MKTQIDKLFKLAPELKEELKRHVIPNCSYIECPHVDGLEIYFANGYDTFLFKNSKETIVMSFYADRIDLKRTVTQKELIEFLQIVKDAIKTLKEVGETGKQKQIE